MSRRVRRRQRKQPHTLQIFLIIVLVLLTVCVLVKAFFLKAPEQKAAELPAQPAASDTDDSQQSQEEQAALRSHLERKGGFYTILVSGVDDGNGGSDTNILVAVDTVNGYVYGVSIPGTPRPSLTARPARSTSPTIRAAQSCWRTRYRNS